jgi:ABC-type multidrug transport system ATPase subunit
VWKNKVSAFVDDSFLIGYLTPEEYFYFIRELRGQNKASVDEFLKPFHDFLMVKSLNPKNISVIFQKEIRKK